MIATGVQQGGGVSLEVGGGSMLRKLGILLLMAAAIGAHAMRRPLLGYLLVGASPWLLAAMAAAGGVMVSVAATFDPPPAPLENLPPDRDLFLYLRPFEVDERSAVRVAIGLSCGLMVYLVLFHRLWWPCVVAPLALDLNLEKGLVSALEPLGAFVALCEPGRRVQPIGANRLRAGDAWREMVLRHLDRARLVIVRPGLRPSIRWEIEQVLARVPPERILFYLHGGVRRRKAQASYDDLRTLLGSRVRGELPARLPRAGFLAFDGEWTPRFVAERGRATDRVAQVLWGDLTLDRLRPVMASVGFQLTARHHPPPLRAMKGFSDALTWAGAAFVSLLLQLTIWWAMLLLELWCLQHVRHTLEALLRIAPR